MKGFKVFAIALLLLAFASATMASDAAKMDVGKSWTLTLHHPTRVGAVLLKAGEYNVRHIKEGDQNYLQFNKGEKKEIARVACTVEQLPQKADATELTENRNGDERVLKAIAFKGDMYRHELNQ